MENKSFYDREQELETGMGSELSLNLTFSIFHYTVGKTYRYVPLEQD